MAQKFFQDLVNARKTERGEAPRASARRYQDTLKTRSKIIASSYLWEFLDEVFSAEKACRFFRTFISRFVSESNGSSEDGLCNVAPVYALAKVPLPMIPLKRRH